MSTQLIRGEVTAQPQPDGTTLYISDEFPPLPADELRAVGDRTRDLLRSP